VGLPSPADGLAEHRVTGPDQALAAFRCLARADGVGDMLAALVLDRWQRICRLCVTPGGAEEVADWLRDRVLPAIPRHVPSAVVLIVSRPGDSTVPGSFELAAWRGATGMCRPHGVVLLDVLIVSGHRWRSLSETNGPPRPYLTRSP
jgi:hypothetical protein